MGTCAAHLSIIQEWMPCLLLHKSAVEKFTNYAQTQWRPPRWFSRQVQPLSAGPTFVNLSNLCTWSENSNIPNIQLILIFSIVLNMSAPRRIHILLKPGYPLWQNIKMAQRQVPCFFHWLYLCINSRQPFSAKDLYYLRLQEKWRLQKYK